MIIIIIIISIAFNIITIISISPRSIHNWQREGDGGRHLLVHRQYPLVRVCHQHFLSPCLYRVKARIIDGTLSVRAIYADLPQSSVAAISAPSRVSPVDSKCHR